MIKTLFWVVLKTKRIKLEGKIEKTFHCNLKLKISHVKNKLLTAGCKKTYYEKNGFSSKKDKI